MKFLLSGVIVTLGLLPLSVQAQPQSFDTQVARMVEALRLAAPKTGSANDGYYSEWQVKPATLTSWSKFCLKKEVSPTEFENNPQLARQVISCVTQRELKGQLEATNNNETQAVLGTACWWMTGKYKGCDSGFSADYVKKVLGYYQKPSK
ncbi:MAG: hypothetical protein HC836_01925 [Richelia sp. RM2_1_2]|nr:hypothetical protein [Richelia sp. SM2_1_7]NJM22478.1 hypothetical protein [Richelia sp. SM1_7_0]NJN09020.1 hypothetical protein [Richelia sp. RM1_1_1]NJO27069.1 hypothetical protein [Richelia sp. SL_2_1]NJO57175.1 hypothetical protein [Richelia sp. RM2_1_2]